MAIVSRKCRGIMVFLTIVALTLAVQAQAGRAAGGEGSRVADFYRGKRLTIIIPFAPGGGFDYYGRLVGRLMETEMDGVTVVPRNISGAAGILGTNLAFQARNDGLTIVILNYPGALFAELTGDSAVNYRMAEWEWIGRIAAVPAVLTISPGSDIETAQDLIRSRRTIKFGLEGKGSDAYYAVKLLTALYGISANLVTGYQTGEADAALIRGEVDAIIRSIDEAYPLIQAGEYKPLLFFSEERSPRLPDVPTIVEIAETEEQLKAMKALAAIYELERVFAAPPGTPKERVEFLRAKFEAVATSEELKEITAQAGRSPAFLPGSRVEELANNVAEAMEVLLPIIAED